MQGKYFGVSHAMNESKYKASIPCYTPMVTWLPERMNVKLHNLEKTFQTNQN
jgi:hypothetical protein